MRAPPPLAALRLPWAAVIALLAVLPFLFVAIPPLIDVPGHTGRFAVQTAPAGSPLLRWYGFHWAFTLNLGADLLVGLFAPLSGLFPAVWLVSAAAPVLTTAGVVTLARSLNPRGAYALPWALLFVFNFPFLWGFLNFQLAAAAGLLVFAAWVALSAKPFARALVILVGLPIILIAHGVGGVICFAAIVGHEFGLAPTWRPGRLAQLWSPLVAMIGTVLVWKLLGAPGEGATLWIPFRKVEAVTTILRDQNIVLDLGSLLACCAVFAAGWTWGARLRPGPAGAVLAVLLVFLATPSLLSGSDRIDTRIAPVVPLLALALQDWSGVAARRRRAIAIIGTALLLLRLLVTTASFAGYQHRYDRELSALDHVRPGARVLNFTLVRCGVVGWRTERLEHLAALATPLRDAWVNAHWSIAGLQLLTVKYRPSPAYYRDPSQLVWPEACIDRRLPASLQVRRTVAEAVSRAPIAAVDYLWLIGVKLPPGYHDPRLRRLWATGESELYTVQPFTAPAR